MVLICIGLVLFKNRLSINSRPIHLPYLYRILLLSKNHWLILVVSLPLGLPYQLLLCVLKLFELRVGFRVLPNGLKPLIINKLGIKDNSNRVWLQRVWLNVNHALFPHLIGWTYKNFSSSQINLHFVFGVTGLVFVAKHTILDLGTSTHPFFLSFQNNWSLNIHSF